MSFRGHFGLYSYCTPSHNTNTTVKLTDDNCGTDMEKRLRVGSELIRTDVQSSSSCSAVLVSVLLQTQSQDSCHLQLCCIDYNWTKSTTPCSVHGLVRPCDPGPELPWVFLMHPITCCPSGSKPLDRLWQPKSNMSHFLPSNPSYHDSPRWVRSPELCLQQEQHLKLQ